jgi:glycosyltransferase involved in cell wall biosynthesis
MDAPPVTIVTPSYNQGRFFRATVESVLSQDYPNLEYLIMDGGSTDETPSIAAEYASRLTFISAPDRGQTHAINKGFRRARGTVLAWVNSDDILLPGAITKAVAGLQATPPAPAVYGEGYRIDQDDRRLGRFPHTEPFNLWKLVFVLDYVLQQSVFLRRSAVEEIGYLDESLHYTMDWDLLIRLGKRWPLHYIPEFLGAIREYPEAKSFAGGAQRVREIRDLLRKHSGMRYAPGYAIYALETWRRWWNAPVTGRIVNHLRAHSQGLSRDGWAATTLRYMVPAGEGPIEIRGLSSSPQTLSIVVNGAAAGEHSVPAGSFRVELKTDGLASLEIIAQSKWVMRSIRRAGP